MLCVLSILTASDILLLKGVRPTLPRVGIDKHPSGLWVTVGRGNCFPPEMGGTSTQPDQPPGVGGDAVAPSMGQQGVAFRTVDGGIGVRRGQAGSLPYMGHVQSGQDMARGGYPYAMTAGVGANGPYSADPQWYAVGGPAAGNSGGMSTPLPGVGGQGPAGHSGHSQASGSDGRSQATDGTAGRYSGHSQASGPNGATRNPVTAEFPSEQPAHGQPLRGAGPTPLVQAVEDYVAVVRQRHGRSLMQVARCQLHHGAFTTSTLMVGGQKTAGRENGKDPPGLHDDSPLFCRPSGGG